MTAVLVAIDAISHQSGVPVGAFVQDFQDAAIVAQQCGDDETAAALSQMARATKEMQYPALRWAWLKQFLEFRHA